jgi:hypothetical protein
MTDPAYDDDLEMAQLEFMEAYENGENPTLEQWCKKYPQYISELVDFILDYVAMENRMKRLTEEERNAPAPQWAIDAMNKALRDLRLSGAFTLSPRCPTPPLPRSSGRES